KTGPDGTCNFDYPNPADLSSCVTFEPPPGASAAFRVAGSGVNQIGICASFISIRNVTVDETDFLDQFGGSVSNSSVAIGSGDSTCMPNGAPPHDVYLENIEYGGQAGATGGAWHVWFVGG